MASTSLPQELIDIIINYIPPQSFESMALTCKANYARCKPFIKRHNQLRRILHDFYFDWERPGRLVAASDLILLIAAEPIAARHICKADLSLDSRGLLYANVRLGPPTALPSIDEGGAIVDLFASSTYLLQAGLDWKVYYSAFQEDVREQRYSQHGAAFLLTLLPDIQHLRLPDAWKPDSATEKLLGVLVERTKQSKSIPSGLSVLTSLEAFLLESDAGQSGMKWASAFLALPHMQTFDTSRCTVAGKIPESLTFNTTSYMADNLDKASLGCCCIDEIGIADFLRHTPRLRSLTYSHMTTNDLKKGLSIRAKHDYLMERWDICKFINAVAREAGDRLVEFSIPDSTCRALPGRASMRRFTKLKKLDFPLELVMCNIGVHGPATYAATSLQRFFFGPVARELIPPSVVELSLKSGAISPHEKAVDALFSHFRAVRKSQFPALQKLSIDRPPISIDPRTSPYVQRVNKVFAEARKEGIECQFT